MSLSIFNHSYIKTAIFAWGSRIVTSLCKIIAIPILLKSLGTEKYAIFLILLSLEAWFLLLDFGLGATIQNALSEKIAQKKEVGEILKTAFIFSCFAFFLGLSLLFSFHSFLSHYLFSQFFVALDQNIILFSGFFLLLGTFGALAGRILMAKQQGFFLYITQGVSNIASLVCISLFQNSLDLPLALFFAVGIPSSCTFALCFLAFQKMNWKAPLAWGLLKKANQFCFFSLMAAFVLSSETLIIPKTLKPHQIVEYGLILKIFNIGGVVYSALLAALWPTFSEKWALKEGFWVVQKVRFFTLLGMGLTTAFTAFILLLTPFLSLFLQIEFSKFSIFLGGLYLMVRIHADFHATALQSRSDLSSFFSLIPVQAILSLSVQWILSLYLGVPGIFIGLILSYLLTVSWALPKRLQILQEKPLS